MVGARIPSLSQTTQQRKKPIMSTKTDNYFEIPVDITIKSTISICKDDACDLDEAIFLAQKAFAKRHEAGSVLDFVEAEEVSKVLTIDHKLAKELNPPKTFSVTVTRTQSAVVTVEAYSADDAETFAIELAESGDVPECDWDTDADLETSDVEEEGNNS